MRGGGRRWLQGAPGRSLLAAALLLTAVALLSASAGARPGGGESFSGGSGSGSSGGGGGGGGDAGFVFELLWLCIEEPALGIPLTLLVIVIGIGKWVWEARQEEWSTAAKAARLVAPAPPAWTANVASPPTPPRPVTPSALATVDPHFSQILFEDFLYSLYAEVHVARGAAPVPPATSPLDRLSAYLTPAAATTLLQATRGHVQSVIVGALRVLRANAGPEGALVEVEFESNLTEAGQAYYVVERWWLTRGPGVTSRPPERVRLLGCPSCGAPQDHLFGGACRHCGRVVNDGTFDWVVSDVRVISRSARGPLLTSTTVERGTDLPTRQDPRLSAELQRLTIKDPAFSLESFFQRVKLIAQQFQSAWTARDLAAMRPFLSDTLYTTQQYYVAAYLAQGLRNVTANTRILRLEPVKLTSDAFYDALTVRLYATGLDYTEREDGQLVAGSKSQERPYSEYWTLIRGTQRRGPARAELSCANCGGPLRVNMAGVCEYCHVKVTTGGFDWVLSRIEQDEVYTG